MERERESSKDTEIEERRGVWGRKIERRKVMAREEMEGDWKSGKEGMKD